MAYSGMGAFVRALDERGWLARIAREIDPYLELAAIADRVMKSGGPALLFENAKGARMPVLANLFGTAERVAAGFGVPPSRVGELGEMLGR